MRQRFSLFPDAIRHSVSPLGEVSYLLPFFPAKRAVAGLLQPLFFIGSSGRPGPAKIAQPVYTPVAAIRSPCVGLSAPLRGRGMRISEPVTFVIGSE